MLVFVFRQRGTVGGSNKKENTDSFATWTEFLTCGSWDTFSVHMIVLCPTSGCLVSHVMLLATEHADFSSVTQGSHQIQCVHVWESEWWKLGAHTWPAQKWWIATLVEYVCAPAAKKPSTLLWQSYSTCYLSPGFCCSPHSFFIRSHTAKVVYWFSAD